MIQESFCPDPTDIAIGKAYFAPSFNQIGNINLCSFMDNEQVNTTLAGRTLYCNCWRKNDGRRLAAVFLVATQAEQKGK